MTGNTKTIGGSNNTIDLILASASPRRRELLTLCGYPFRCETAAVDEAALTAAYLEQNSEAKDDFTVLVGDLVTRLAQAKCEAVAGLQISPCCCLGADTVVLLNRQILGKPKDIADARRQLHALCGRTHEVLTGVYLTNGERGLGFYESAEVTFYPLDDYMERLIDDYVISGSPMDKAGSYGIQDEGAKLISSISGDYYTIMGLPVGRLARVLDQLFRCPEIA